MVHPSRVPVLLTLAAFVFAACQPPAPSSDATPAAEPTTAAISEATADAEASPPAEGAAQSDGDGPLVIYSGRSETLIGPLIDRFRAESGLEVDMRWGSTATLAATLLEEGENSPADVFFAQDPGGLGAVSPKLSPLPQDLLDQVPAGYRDPDGRWVGVSGRARTLVYNTELVKPEDLPDDLDGLTDPSWRGRMGWAPGNASFQAMVSAMRQLWGDDRTAAWLEGMKANQTVAYESNAPIVAAVGAGEVEIGLVNHYYLYRFLEEEGPDFPARNAFMPGGGPGSMVLVAGVGILDDTPHRAAAERFVRFLLEPEAQRFFAAESREYPLVEGHDAGLPADLPPLSGLNPPSLALGDLEDVQGTTDLLRRTGVLP